MEKCLKCGWVHTSECVPGFHPAKRHAMEAEKLLNGWTPCKVKMPEPSQSVLVWDGVDCGVGWQVKGHLWNTYPEFLSIPTHWMPLPEPPSA